MTICHILYCLEVFYHINFLVICNRCDEQPYEEKVLVHAARFRAAISPFFWNASVFHCSWNIFAEDDENFVMEVTIGINTVQ